MAAIQESINSSFCSVAERTSGETNDSGLITPGIMFTVKQHHLTSVQGA